MIGNLKWNISLGLFGLIITLLANIGNNPLPTSFLRSLYVFACLFVLGFVIRFVLGHLAGVGGSASAVEPMQDGEEEAYKGTNIDLSTPEDDGFSPLAPPSISSEAPVDNPEKIANVIRRMTDQ